MTVSCRELPASEYPETITKLDAIAAADSSATGCRASPKHSSPTNSEPHTDDAEYAVFELTVADTGIGMSREFQAHAFEPFAQENTASRASYMGTGLGLAIAHEIIEKMGGDIAFQSEQGQGHGIHRTSALPHKRSCSPDREEPRRAAASLGHRCEHSSRRG